MKVILAFCLQSLFLHFSGRQAEPLGFHNIMFAYFFSSGKKQLAAFLPSSSPLICIYFIVFLSLGRSLYKAWYVGLCVIHKGVSCVLTVQIIISVNLNKSAYQKYFLDSFFTLTAHSWTLSCLWLHCASNSESTLVRMLILRP